MKKSTFLEWDKKELDMNRLNCRLKTVYKIMKF